MNSGWLAWECIVFAIFIFASSVAPLWKRRRDAAQGESAKRAYIFAGGGVSTLAMILSVARGTLGVRSFLGFPSELVYHGSAMWETLYGIILAFPIVCWVFVPVYYRLHTNSVYEYLQMRFNCIWVRRLAAATFLIRQLLNLAVTVYTPSVALHAILALPHWASAAALTAVAIVFNLLGGLAAAIRADVIQTLTMIIVSAAFIIQATVKAGGPQQVLSDNIDGGRLKFFQFTWDPTVRVDTLSAIIGQLFMSISVYGCQQTFVQRYCSMSSESRVRRTLLANVPAVTILFSLSWVVGMAIYAVYKYCDPLAAGQISAPDEVLPYYVQDQFNFLPGMLGLFLGSLFNGALSFLVSNVNSLATVTWEDFVSAVPYFTGTTDKQQLTVIKIIGIIYALVIMGLSLCVGAVGGVVEGSLLVTSATSGALLGVFTLAALCPVANGKGALWGMIASHVITTWMAAGRLLYVDKREDVLPLSTEGCENGTVHLLPQKALLSAGFNQTLMRLAPLLQTMDPSRAPPPEDPFYSSALYKMYAVSYMWYAVIGTLTCVVLGVLIGALTGGDGDKFDERLLHPVVAQLYRKMPGAKRTYSTEKTGNENEKESSVKTDITIADDIRTADVISVSEVKNAVHNNMAVMNYVLSQDANYPTIPDLNMKHNLQMNGHIVNSNNVDQDAAKNNLNTEYNTQANNGNVVHSNNINTDASKNVLNNTETVPDLNRHNVHINNGNIVHSNIHTDTTTHVNNTETISDLNMKHNVQMNNGDNVQVNNGDNVQTNNDNIVHSNNVDLKSQVGSTGVSSNSSRLFDAYEPQRSPTLSRTRL